VGDALGVLGSVGSWAVVLEGGGGVCDTGGGLATQASSEGGFGGGGGGGGCIGGAGGAGVGGVGGVGWLWGLGSCARKCYVWGGVR